jgi:hypothetical protein
LLLLSRAFKITEARPAGGKEDTVEALKDTFSMLSEDTIADVEMDQFKSDASLEKRLDYVKRVEEDIEQEAETAAELKAVEEQLEVCHNVVAFTLAVFPPHSTSLALVDGSRYETATCLGRPGLSVECSWSGPLRTREMLGRILQVQQGC